MNTKRTSKTIVNVGEKYGKLTVVSLQKYSDKALGKNWNCACECGGHAVRNSLTLKYGVSPCCEVCSSIKRTEALRKRITKHGMSQTPTAVSWSKMLQRCYDKKHPAFHHYGGRGILPCEFIKASPVHLVYLIGERPDGLTLERQDTNKGYWCGQCAQCIQMGWTKNISWASYVEQGNNRRNNALYCIDGETMTQIQWARRKGMDVTTFKRNHKQFRIEQTEVLSG